MPTKLSCKNCDEYSYNGKGNYCTYSCNKNRTDRYKGDSSIENFVKDLYEASGIFVSRSEIYKNMNLLREYL